jgi:putative glutamine amidotransferase
MRPLIGLTMYRQPASWGTWRDVDADLLPADYARAVRAAGGLPVLLPSPSPDGTGDAATTAPEVIARLDGLLIAGGADINPARYGQEPDPHVVRWYDDRDAWELALLAAADAVALPVLGICRGMQLMAVAAGGSLVQHLPDVVGHDRHSGGDGYEHVPVDIAQGHRISQLLGSHVVAPCHHHQAVAQHPGYVATARDADGVLQAMEKEGEPFRVGVQWHPETSDEVGLFSGLVAAAAAWARGRADAAG